jgi:transposase
MIVIGVDVDKQSLTAVAVDEAGRMLEEQTVAVNQHELVGWAAGLSVERLRAIEDCRQLTRSLERDLIAADEQLVRVPPKLMAPERRTGRERGKSDPIDALAVARAALREPRLSRVGCQKLGHACESPVSEREPSLRTPHPFRRRSNRRSSALFRLSLRPPFRRLG